jgi:hypothetical protein
MKLFQWLKAAPRTRLALERRRKDPFRAARFLPLLEELESRWVPSTLTVTNTSDSGAGSLRAAIMNSQAGDTIAFASNLSGGTINLASEIAIDHDLVIQGVSNLTVDGGGTARVFDISGGANVSVSNLTIADGMAGANAPNPGEGGGIFDDSGQLQLNNVPSRMTRRRAAPAPRARTAPMPRVAPFSSAAKTFGS